MNCFKYFNVANSPCQIVGTNLFSLCKSFFSKFHLGLLCFVLLVSTISNGIGQISLSNIIEASEGVDGDEFSYDFDIDESGDYLVIGSRYDDERIIHQGSAYVFQKSDDDLWVELVKIPSPEPERNSYFGWAVATSNQAETIVISTVRKDNVQLGKSSTGTVYIYKKDGTSWKFIQLLQSPNQLSQTKFGDFIEISPDGNILIIAEGGGNNEVQVYEYMSNRYVYKQSLKHGTRSFTHKIALNDNEIFVSHYSDDLDGVKNAGEIWVYAKNNETWSVTQRIRQPLFENSNFSYNFNVAGNFLIASSEGINNHKVHIYKKEMATWVHVKSIGPYNVRKDYLSLVDLVIQEDYAVVSVSLRNDMVLLLYDPKSDFNLVDSFFVGKRGNNFGTPLEFSNGSLLMGASSEGKGILFEYSLKIAKKKLTLYDANSKFISTGFLGVGTVNDIQEIEDASELSLAVDRKVELVSCDGISEVLVQIPFEEEVKDVHFSISPELGKLEFPWGKKSIAKDNIHYLYALYTAPEDFPNKGEGRKEEGIDVIEVSQQLTITNMEFNESGYDLKINLIRPPIVLVHGTFDNPTNCWETSIAGEEHMLASLENTGLKVFSLDYQKTNGMSDDQFIPFGPLISSFEGNKKVVYDNPGGIKEALDFYRNELKVAATQVDVIGHSMGGVLPRVLASDSDIVGNRYNDDYYRNDNFNDGDINRLITIASTHHGSDLSYFQSFFNDSWKNSELPMLERLVNTAIPFGVWLGSGLHNTGAVQDQIPVSPALRRIGATKIPSHAIVCTVEDIAHFEGNIGEPEGDLTYANFLKASAAFFYFYKAGLTGFMQNLINDYKRLPGLLQNGSTMSTPFLALPKDEVLAAKSPLKMKKLQQEIDDGFSEFWQNWHILQDDFDDEWIIDDDEYLLQYETAEYNMNELDDSFLDLIKEERWDVISGEYPNKNVVKEDTKQKAVDFLRYLIFKNDLNDGVVRYESQKGGLEAPYITHFDEHIHSYAPRYPDIINRVIGLLKGGMEEFNEEGFPGAGKKMAISLPDPQFIKTTKSGNSFDRMKMGNEAACWSGMVPEHAWAFAEIAARRDVVILARPVNPDATPLIKQNAATKGMNLKGKSSNWGPQKGYIPVNQRYSKIWNLSGDNHSKRDSQIIEFTLKTTKQLRTDTLGVVRRDLFKSFDCASLEPYQVFVDTTISDAEKSVFLVQENNEETTISLWSKTSTCPVVETENVSISQLAKMEVMAKPNPGFEPNYFTADYDLLAIGFEQEGLAGWEDDPYDIPRLDNFNKEKGFITEDQDALLDDLNDAVRETGYTGGNVSHHGPENQYYIWDTPENGSPYVDYPIIAFYKEGGKGKIMAIPRGEKGFRDIHLKRFMAKKRREGYNLYENIRSPGWNWDFKGKYSFEKGWPDQDAPNLPSSPEEIPFPDQCDSDKIIKAISTIVDGKALLEFENRNVLKDYSLLYPNPTLDRINIVIYGKEDQAISYAIVGRDGIQYMKGQISLQVGRNEISIDINELTTGSYFLMLYDDKKVSSKLFNVVK